MKRRPKKTNPSARKAKSRHEKVNCPECSQRISSASIGAHYALSHPEKETDASI